MKALILIALVTIIFYVGYRVIKFCIKMFGDTPVDKYFDKD